MINLHSHMAFALTLHSHERADCVVESTCVQQPPKGVLALVPIREKKACTRTSIDRVWGERVQIYEF